MTVHEPDLRPADVPPAASDPTEAGGILTIDLAAIEANWKMLAGMTVPVECAAVVKANAYGCGLEPVTRTLSEAGCRTFFVADVAEGRRVRALAPEAVIYVLNGLMPGSAPAFAADYLRPVINSTTELAEWDTFVATNDCRHQELARRRGAPRRHRDEPARDHSGRGGCRRSAHAIGKSWLHAVDESSRLRRDPRSSDE